MSYAELEAGYKGIMGTNYHFYYSACSSLPQYARTRLPSMSDVDDEDSSGESGISSKAEKNVIVGVCAMGKKSGSKPMLEILSRLDDFEYVKTLIFPEETILKCPIEEWPIVDCLVSFHSKGFPLEKTMSYARLRNPYIINNIDMQFELQDRRQVYKILSDEGIMLPRYAILDRDSPDVQNDFIESDDHIEVNGVIFNKPFVEKPISAEDHNIYIYYPTSAGGGSQRLFRKIGSRSSVYSPESRVRKTGSYIYEDFMPTDGTDVKVYTVGPDYAHAEARKSPALDGKVERDSEGKEVRYPVILSALEKLIARKVCLAFKQTVCGFDLLRANGKSYVCDVNGFSFVKNSNKYYDDCARILGNMILRELAPTLHIPWAIPFQLDDPPIVPTTFGKMMELRCVVGVIRHGDRTPKQKMKMEVRHPKFFELFEKYGGSPENNVKLKKPKQLQEVLDIARFLLYEVRASESEEKEIEEKRGKLDQLKSVLEMYGYFSGINRKVQLKYQPKGRPRGSSSDDISSNGISDDEPQDPSLVLILKWGGELTPAGRVQAEELGRIFRCMYPGGQGQIDTHKGLVHYETSEYAGTQGLGLLRLHSTFRHDLKIYASDEGRVQMTAAAFAKGLLALEGELTPILVQMVKSAHTNGLLDNDCESSKFQRHVKHKLHEMMQQDKDLTPEEWEKINPTKSISVENALKFIKNPVQCCERVLELINKLMVVIKTKRDGKSRDATLYHGESWDLMARRWGKLEKDFQTKGGFDISKIPDIYDCIKYDIQHNLHAIGFDQAEELYIYSKNLADIVIPQEYGINKLDKLAIGQGICSPLLKKIRSDLQRNVGESDTEPDTGDECVNRLNPSYSHGVSSPGRHVRTRLYFTSESHIHSLLTMIRYGGLGLGADITATQDEQWNRAMEYVSAVSELNYLTQIVIMLYEDPTKDLGSEERFHIELHFSPGVNCCIQKNFPPGPGFRPNSRSDTQKQVSVDVAEGDKDKQKGAGSQNSLSAADSEVTTKLGQAVLVESKPKISPGVLVDSDQPSINVQAVLVEPVTIKLSAKELLKPDPKPAISDQAVLVGPAPVFPNDEEEMAELPAQSSSTTMPIPIVRNPGCSRAIPDGLAATGGCSTPNKNRYREASDDLDFEDVPYQKSPASEAEGEFQMELGRKKHKRCRCSRASVHSGSEEKPGRGWINHHRSTGDGLEGSRKHREVFGSNPEFALCRVSKSELACSSQNHSSSSGSHQPCNTPNDTNEFETTPTHDSAFRKHKKSRHMGHVHGPNCPEKHMSQMVRGLSFENYFAGRMEGGLGMRPSFNAFNKGGPTSLFSTAVITGYSASDNQSKAQYETPMPMTDASGRFPPIRPLETLHNALSFKELDSFLERILSVHYRPATSLTPSCNTMELTPGKKCVPGMDVSTPQGKTPKSATSSLHMLLMSIQAENFPDYENATTKVTSTTPIIREHQLTSAMRAAAEYRELFFGRRIRDGTHFIFSPANSNYDFPSSYTTPRSSSAPGSAQRLSHDLSRANFLPRVIQPESACPLQAGHTDSKIRKSENGCTINTVQSPENLSNVYRLPPGTISNTIVLHPPWTQRIRSFQDASHVVELPVPRLTDTAPVLHSNPDPKSN